MDLSPRLRVACLQLTASDNMAANIDTLRGLAITANSQGARLISMPENAVMMTWGRDNLLTNAFVEEHHPALVAFEDLARDLQAWLHIGSLHILIEDGKRLANRSYLINPKGIVTHRYDKLHMFDVELSNGERYRESAVFAAGNEAVIAPIQDGLGMLNLGLSICYDLRFPQLYREYAQTGAHILMVPAAFTKTTGEAHWHSLLRARAIETGCYVMAAAQTGKHAHGRETYGHSLIVDPWGKIIADGQENDSHYILADIDMQNINQARKQIPSLTHDRAFAMRSA